MKLTEVCPECRRPETDYRRVYQSEAGEFIGHAPIMVCTNPDCGRFVRLSDYFRKVGADWEPVEADVNRATPFEGMAAVKPKMVKITRADNQNISAW